jgi:UDP-N-acetylglucosamine/UDP-N-acetylgalactosamine diphosphorylase
LLRDVAEIEFPLLDALLKKWILHPPAPEHFSKIEAIPIIPPITERNDDDARTALEAGEEVLRAGKVGVFLVAGGQGTRLGTDGPKGAYPIGPITGKSFFMYHAYKIHNKQNRYGVEFPWYVMVSRENAEATRDYFTAHHYFDLKPEQVMFIEQAMMPCVDANGKILLKDKGVIAMNPNGHGGCITAMRDGGVLSEAQQRGVEHLSYFQVDNWAANLIDPYFIGYHVLRKAEMSSKVHLKTTPRESVGVHCLCDGEYRIIEYSELDLYPQLLETDSGGKPLLNAGNSAIHILDVAFVEKIAENFAQFPWHLAHKKIPHITPNGKHISPHEANGYKFETFVFDALRFTGHSPSALVINRAGEYTPVKHFDGSSSVTAARREMNDYWAQWLEAVGVHVPRDEAGHCIHAIEINPRFAATKEEFAEKSPHLPPILKGDISLDANGNFE